MRFITYALLTFALSSCTFSVNNTCSVGRADDLIDQDQKADADVSPNLNIPVIP